MASKAEGIISEGGLLSGLFAPFARSVPRHIRDDLIALQYDRLKALTPLLHITIAANTIAMAVAVIGDLPLWQQLTPPAIILLSTIWHLIYWYRADKNLSTEAMLRRLVRAVPVAGAIGLTAGIWGVNAFVETERYYCVVAPVFVALSALVSANCLTSVPRAAMASMIGALGPLVAKMLFFPNLGVRSMAVMLVLIGLLQSRLVLSKFAETVKMLMLQHDIVQLAEADALTGIKNRRAWAATIADMLAAQRAIIVAMVDLDGFKAANDAYGHQAGDAVLVEVVRRMTYIAGSAACIARLGGDEFALVFDAGVSAAQAEREIAAVRAVLGLPYFVTDVPITISASVGIAYSPADGTEMTTLMQVADRALYRAKGRPTDAELRIVA